MWRKVARKEKPVAGWSFAVILYVLSGSLCVSYHLLAPISGWAQGTNPASLECCRNVDKLMQFYYTGLLHECIYEYEFMDKLVSCDAFSPALQPISKRKKGCLKKINVRGFFISLFMFICSAGSTVLSFLLLLFGLGTMKVTLSLFVISLCMSLVVIQYKLFYHVVTVNTQVVNHECVQERGNQHTHGIFWKIVVCVTVYAKVYFSRAIFNLRVLISTLLLMSGDVETNPGPPADNPPKSPTDSGDISPTHSTLSQSSLDSISESVRSNHSSNSLPHSSVSAKAAIIEVSSQVPKPEFSKPVSEEGVDSSGESAVRKQMTLTNDSQLQFVHRDTTNAHILRENVDGAEETDLTDTLVAQTKPELAAKHEKGKSRLVPPTFPKLPQSEDNTHAAVQIQDQKREEQRFVYPTPYHTVHPDEFLEPKYKRFTEDQVRSFCEANECYRSEREYTVTRIDGTTFSKCALCGSEKKEICNSHIIPDCIFKVFQEVHNYASVRTQTVYDSDSRKVMYTKSLTQKILCETCEQNSSPSEKKLKELYTHILAFKHKKKRFYYKDDDEWLWYILANIMFRGLLVNVNLTKELFRNEDFEIAFFDLWMYCKQPDSSKRPDRPNLRLFLYPDRIRFKEECVGLVYPFELLIRMPHYTELIGSKETGSFSYTKFDFFHVVLPIGKTVFQQYKNGLVLKTFKGDTYITGILTLADLPQTGSFKRTRVDTWLPNSFPTELMGWNLQLYNSYLPLVWNKYRLKSKCQFIMVKSHNVSDLTTYMYRDTGECADDDPPKPETEEVIVLCKQECDVLIKEASKCSPLRWASDLHLKIKEQWTQIGILENKLEELSCERDELQQERRDIASELKKGYDSMQLHDSTHVVETMKLHARIKRFINHCILMKSQCQTKIDAAQEHSSKEIQRLQDELARQRKFHSKLIGRPPPRRHSSLTEDDVKIVNQKGETQVSTLW